MEVENINIWVSSGNFSKPFYRFYSNKSGDFELANLDFNTSKSYTFFRLDDATSHPFFISDRGFLEASSDAITITGDGQPGRGIIGKESFTLSFNQEEEASDKLIYYCSSHKLMQGYIQLTEDDIDDHAMIEKTDPTDQQIIEEEEEEKEKEEEDQDLKTEDFEDAEDEDYLDQEEEEEDEEDEDLKTEDFEDAEDEDYLDQEEEEEDEDSHLDFDTDPEQSDQNHDPNQIKENDNPSSSTDDTHSEILRPEDEKVEDDFYPEDSELSDEVHDHHKEDSSKDIDGDHEQAIEAVKDTADITDGNEVISENNSQVVESDEEEKESHDDPNASDDNRDDDEPILDDEVEDDGKGDWTKDEIYDDYEKGNDEKDYSLEDYYDNFDSSKDSDYTESKPSDEANDHTSFLNDDRLSFGHLNHGQIKREYLLYVPDSYSLDSDSPLVLNFHGFSGSSIDQFNTSNWTEIANTNGVIVVYPQGTELDSGETHWNPHPLTADNKSSTNDLDFVEALIEHLSSSYSIDLDRVYATGYSNGGGMAYGLAVHKPELVAAIAPVSALMDEAAVNIETNSVPVAIAHFNGTEDTERPINGAPGYLASIEDTATYWADVHSVSNIQQIEMENETDLSVTLSYFYREDGEDLFSPVQSYVIHNGGHEWFDLGIDEQTLDETIWSFLSSFARQDSEIIQLQPSLPSMAYGEGGIKADIIANDSIKSQDLESISSNESSLTLSLRGDSTVGQIISIDNFDSDESVEFQYSWEYSIDKGITWSVISSPDATDGDSFYTLISEDAGHRLRGVASSLDSEGDIVNLYTNEMLIPDFELKIIGKPNIGQALSVDVIGLNETQVDIIQYGWQSTVRENSIIIDASDFHSDNTGIFYQGEEIIVSSHIPNDELDGDKFTTVIAVNGIDVVLEVADSITYGPLTTFETIKVLHSHTPTDTRNFVDGFAIMEEGEFVELISSPTREEEMSAAFGDSITIDANNNHYSTFSTGFFPGTRIAASREGSKIRAFMEYEESDGLRGIAYSSPLVIQGPLETTNFLDGTSEPFYTHNSAPTGNLLIEGNPEAGQVISLDTTSIVDEDGFESDFSHSWQIFDNELGKWLNLNRPDGTNEDKIFTLTDDLIGRTLRGVVSYTDGSGLTQSVASDVITVITTLPLSPDGPKTQTVYTELETISYAPGTSIEVPLLYDTGNNDARLSGLSLNVHYDSSVLTPIDGGVRSKIHAPISSTQIKSDVVDDLDNDPITDKFIELNWGGFDSSFPNKNLPATVATLEFKTSSQETDLLTGKPMSTQINTTASEAAANFEFLSTSTTLQPTSFSLDVDGDGSITALGDGLMVIRKLFGSAFSGDALTHKARSDNASRSNAEIHNFIQVGIDSLALDVDRDGQVTALGDGLMIVRHLFGSAFSGSGLIHNAISMDSEFHGQDDAWRSVAANINALLPED